MADAKRKAVVLLSGGVDSSTVLAIARDEGYDCIALSFEYGQRHKVELDAARRIADAIGVVEHRIVAIDLRAIGGSALTSDAIDVPKGPGSGMPHFRGGVNIPPPSAGGGQGVGGVTDARRSPELERAPNDARSLTPGTSPSGSGGRQQPREVARHGEGSSDRLGNAPHPPPSPLPQGRGSGSDIPAQAGIQADTDASRATLDSRIRGHDGRGIPVTYVPARNTIFLSVALGVAEACGARDMFIGVNAVDYSGYPDCRPAFIEAFERLANLATKAGVEGDRFRVHAPLLHLTKKQIIERGVALRVDYALTVSCYDPEFVDGKFRECGRCDSCRLRAAGFRAAGMNDPAQGGG